MTKLLIPFSITAALLLHSPGRPQSLTEPPATTAACPQPQSRDPNRPPFTASIIPFRTPSPTATAYGLAVHIGDSIALTVHHGTGNNQTQFLVNRNWTQANQISADPDADLTLWRLADEPDATMNFAPTLPQIGEKISWDYGAGPLLAADERQLIIHGQAKLGESGSPAWTSQGLVGIITSVRCGDPPATFATALPTIRRFISQSLPQRNEPPPTPPAPPKPLTIWLQILDENGTITSEARIPIDQPIRLQVIPNYQPQP